MADAITHYLNTSLHTPSIAELFDLSCQWPIVSTPSKNLYFVGSATPFDDTRNFIHQVIDPASPPSWKKRCNSQLKIWLRTVKHDAELILGPHLYGFCHWNCEWLALITETDLNHRAWSASVQNVVNLEKTDPTNPWQWQYLPTSILVVGRRLGGSFHRIVHHLTLILQWLLAMVSADSFVLIESKVASHGSFVLLS